MKPINQQQLLVAIGVLALFSPVHARSINVNFAVNPLVDNQTIDADETSIGGLPGTESVAGTGWNNINTRNNASAGDPVFFRAATQGGNSINLKDRTLGAIRGGTTLTADVTATPAPAEIDVYLLGGQSNMQGTALTAALTPAQRAVPGILLYTAGSGVNGAIANQLVPLQPANGNTFGLEIGIGERLRSLRPGRPMAFIKYAVSGTSLEIGWKPGANNADTANQGPDFKAFVTTVNNGLAALEAAGWTPVIRGMCWQQGEQDAKDGLDVAESDTSADDYGANLAAFVGRVRQQFAGHAGPSGIRFVPGQVLPYAPPGGDVDTRFPGRALVRQAILNADEDSGSPLSIANTEAVPTNEVDHPSHEQEIDGYRDDDEVHQNATALLAIGRSMAYALLDLGPQS
jgi:hypothetical protein